MVFGPNDISSPHMQELRGQVKGSIHRGKRVIFTDQKNNSNFLCQYSKICKVKMILYQVKCGS